MNVDGRPRLASLSAIKDDLTRESQEQGRVQRLRIITRHPDRYADFILEGWSVDVAWCTPRPGQDRIAYTADALVQDVHDNVTKATAYVIDVLDVLGPTSDDIARWLLRLDDTCTNRTSTCTSSSTHPCIRRMTLPDGPQSHRRSPSNPNTAQPQMCWFMAHPPPLNKMPQPRMTIPPIQTSYVISRASLQDFQSMRSADASSSGDAWASMSLTLNRHWSRTMRNVNRCTVTSKRACGGRLTSTAN